LEVAELSQDLSFAGADTVFVIAGSADNDYPEFAARAVSFSRRDIR